MSNCKPAEFLKTHSLEKRTARGGKILLNWIPDYTLPFPRIAKRALPQAHPGAKALQSEQSSGRASFSFPEKTSESHLGGRCRTVRLA